MYKLILFILPFLGTSDPQGHRFELKFYNINNSCLKTVSVSGIDSVDWANQEYTIKTSENITDIRIYGGHIDLCFDGTEVLSVALFDLASSHPLPENRPFSYTINGHINDLKRSFYITCRGKCAILDAFIANREILNYLKEQHVEVN